MIVILDLALMLLTIAGIIVACEAFTNSIEWLGKKLDLTQGAVGSVLAAVGTALPETLIPILAIASAAWNGTHEGREIGLGAIIGAPFMLSSLAMFVTGVAILIFARQGRRAAEVRIDPALMTRDLGFFLGAYGVAIASSFLPWYPLKVGLGILLLGSYGLYVHRTLSHPGEMGEDLGPLYFARAKVEPGLGVVIAQVLASLAGILLGAHFFVDLIASLSQAMHVAPLVLSLVIAPIATELPEKFNSVLWVRVRKDTLALGNITGAMVFQSTIPVTVGLWFTDWRLDRLTMVSAALALGSALWFYLEIKSRRGLSPFSLMRGGLFYAIFLGAVWAWHT